jgi:hypothetical protein
MQEPFLSKEAPWKAGLDDMLLVEAAVTWHMICVYYLREACNMSIQSSMQLYHDEKEMCCLPHQIEVNK